MAAAELDWFVTGGGLELEIGHEASRVGETIGRVRLTELLGRGGMGAVYRGFDGGLERDVAVKVLRSVGGGDAARRARLRDEARLLSAAEHPAICGVYDLVEGDACDYLVLEFVRGRTLDAWLEAGGDGPVSTEPVPTHPVSTGARPTETARLRVLRRVGEALAAAHARDIVHRDLKPGNVMVTGDGTGEGDVKVLDFGIAVSVRPAEALDDVRSGAPSNGDRGTAGTVLYMSPEQARGERVGPASDVFSLGLLVQEVLTGRGAYPRDLALPALVRRVARGETEPADELPAHQQAVLRQLLDPIASRRPTAAQAALALEDLELAPLRRRRRRLRVALVAVVGLVLVGALLAVGWQRLAAARTTAVIEDVSREAAEVAWTMRVAQLGPTRDLSATRDDLLARVASLEERLPALPAAARGLAASAIGRALLELGDIDAARDRLDEAWAAGADDAATAWARGRTYGRLWARAQEERQATRGQAAPDDPESDALLRVAVEMLDQAGGAAPVELFAALRALYEDRPGDGLVAARRLAAADPASWRAPLLEARLLRHQASALVTAGDYDAGASRFASAGRAAGRAIAIGRSAPEAWLEACRNAVLEARIRVRLLRQPYDEELREPAERLCRGALDVAPWSRAARTWVHSLAVHAVRFLADAAEAERVAAASLGGLDALVAEDPEDAAAPSLRAAVRMALAERRMSRGAEVGSLHDLAIADRRRVLDLRPAEDDAYIKWCEALGGAAIHAVQQGRAVAAEATARRLETYSDALAAGEERFPESAYFPSSRQLALVLLGWHRARRGGDCAEPYSEALELAEQLARGDERIVRINGANAGTGLVGCRLRDGVDPGDAAERALALARSAVELAPDDAAAILHEAQAHLAVARSARARGVVDAEAFARAVAARARGAALDPGNREALVSRAVIHLFEAAARLDHGRPVAPPLSSADDARETIRRRLGEEAPEMLWIDALRAAIESRRVADALDRARRLRDRAAAAGAGADELSVIDAELERARAARPDEAR